MRPEAVQQNLVTGGCLQIMRHDIQADEGEFKIMVIGYEVRDAQGM